MRHQSATARRREITYDQRAAWAGARDLGCCSLDGLDEPRHGESPFVPSQTPEPFAIVGERSATDEHPTVG
jgi:hypothetical protein